MRKGICPKCRQVKLLTKHSKSGSHLPPFEYICRECHNKIHEIRSAKRKYNRKYMPGTPNQHKRKKYKKRKC